MIVHTDKFVTLLGGGDLPKGALEAALELAPALVAADGGADAALALGLMPQAVIGDLDSLSADARARLDAATVHELAEQTSTDFDKALRNITARGVLAVGFTGGRADHELAAYHTLVSRRSPPCIVLGAEDIVFAAPPALDLSLWRGCRVSLFPMAPVTGCSTGLRWPIEGLDFGPLSRIGTSNEATGAAVSLRFEAPGMLVILPREALVAAVDALF